MKEKEKKIRPYQGVNDEIREQHEKTKDMSLKGKLSYFWYYYKIHTLAALVILIVASSLIYDIATRKDFNFYCVMLNNVYMSGDLLEESFGEYANLDMENYECAIDTDATFSYTDTSNFSAANFQKLIALVQSHELDSMIIDSQVCYNFACNEVLADLRTILTEEELKQYEGKIYYIDFAPARAADESEEALRAMQAEYSRISNLTPEEAMEEAKLHRSPAGMEEPVPVGIFMDDAPSVTKTNDYTTCVPIYAFSSTSERVEPAKQYLTYLWDDSVAFEDFVETVY